MTFQNPTALTLILTIPAMIAFLVWRNRVYRAQIRKLGEASLISRLLPPPDQRQLWQGVLWAVTLTALIIALARPMWGVNIDVIEVQGVSVVVALDVSNSMAAQDMLPGRLERAKIAIRELFQELNGNEIGLVLFAGSAFVYFPLTTDANAATTFLSPVSTSTISEQGTALEEAINLALATFNPQSPAARILVLMTDGESHVGEIERAIERANSMGVVIHTIGYGSAEGAPVPILNDQGEAITYKADTTGNLVLTYLDEETLQFIADETGGIYQRATASGVEITNLARVIQQAETGFLDNRIESQGIERFGLFILAAIIALTLEILLPARRAAT